MKLFKIDLRAFDGGAGAGAAQGGDGAASAQPQGAPGAGVASGVETAQDPGAAKLPGEARQAAKPTFDDLIRGEYKEAFRERVRGILDRRLKNTRAELDAMRPVMAILQQRYHVEDGRGAAAAVLEALQKDDAYWQSAADAAGMTAEQYRRLATAEAHSRELQSVLSAQQTEQRRQEVVQRLNAEAEQVRAAYPDFDLNAELQSGSAFGDLLKNGVDMLTAYQVCHHQDFLAAAQQRAETRAQDAVKANRARPQENGSGSGQPAKLSGDPSKWTREQFRDVERRVQRGERIVL